MQFFLTSAVLNLSGLEKFRASLEEAMQQFIALSGTDSDPQSLEKKLALPDQGVTLPVSYDRNAPRKTAHRLCPRQHRGVSNPVTW